MPTGSGPRIAVSLFPSSPCSSTVRIETGTSAFSSPTSPRLSPRGLQASGGSHSASQARRAPVATASETSLTVPPRAFLIRLNSARSKVSQANSRRGPTAGRVDRHLRGRPHEVPGHLPEADEPVAGAVRGVGGIAGGAGQPAGEATEGRDDAGRGVDDEAGAGGRAVRAPGLLGLGRRRGRLDVEEQHPDVDGGDPVGHRVVGLVDDREALLGEPVDQGQLPERLARGRAAARAAPRRAPGTRRRCPAAEASRGRRGGGRRRSRRRPRTACRARAAVAAAAGAAAAAGGAASGSARGTRPAAAATPRTSATAPIAMWALSFSLARNDVSNDDSRSMWRCAISLPPWE